MAHRVPQRQVLTLGEYVFSDKLGKFRRYSAAVLIISSFKSSGCSFDCTVENKQVGVRGFSSEGVLLIDSRSGFSFYRFI
jgi:hypothetical protein